MDKTLTEAGRLLASSHRIVITTHLMPDGDGLGAEIALYHYLQRCGKSVKIINPDPVPARYRFLDTHGVFEIIDLSAEVQACDLLVVVDTNDPKRLGKVWDTYQEKAKDILFFDHHPALHVDDHPEATRFGLRIHEVIDEKSSSIGELLYRLFHAAHDLMDPRSASFRFSPEIALGLYVSIITDTNSFRYARTTALSHRIAADLIDYGLQPEEIYQNVYSSKSIDHLRLIGEVLSQANEVARADQGTIVWVEISKKLRQKYNAKSDDTQSIVNFLLLVKKAEILCLIREEDDGRIKVSLKSKGVLKVNAIASKFGGGGHEFAAGFTAKGTIKEVREKLLACLTS